MESNVKGFEELRRKLDRLSNRDYKTAVRKGTRAGAKLLAPIIRQAMPKRTGAAAKQVKVRAMKRSRKWVGHRVEIFRPPGATILYIAVVNYGRKRRPLIARRFLNAAAQGSEGRIVSATTQFIADEIDHFAAKD